MKKIFTFALIVLPIILNASSFKPLFIVDKSKICLTDKQIGDTITFTNVTDESLWDNVNYKWKFLNTNTNDSIIKNGYGPFTLFLTEGDWVVSIWGGNNKTPQSNGESKQIVYLGRNIKISMKNNYIGCNNDTVEVSADPRFEKYYWFKNGDTIGKTKNIKILNSGKYNLTTISFASCISKDSIFVTKEICLALNKENKIESDISINPNPANDIIFIKGNIIDSENKDVKIAILNIIGKEVFSENFIVGDYFKKELNLSSLPKGIYVINFVIENIVIKSNRLILN